MRYYGEPIDDLKIKTPKHLPQYVEDSHLQKLLVAVREKRSHKGTVERELLIIELHLKTGMRRNELAELKVKDVHKDFIIVISGKGKKDRMIPLPPKIAIRLNDFIRDKKPEDRVIQEASRQD